MSKDVASKKDDFQQLNRELEVTEQACSSLQKSFQEFCPDIRHQETEVKRLRNRYSNINSQLQQRSERPSSLLCTVCLLFTWGKYNASDLWNVFANFLLHRATLLQEAVNKNQEFHSAVQSLTAFLINMPNNKVRPGESVSQVYAKQNSQMVSIKFFSKF